MPIRVYPPEVERVYVTASRRNFSGSCTTATSSTVPETTSNLKSIKIRTATGWETPGWRKMKNAGALLPFTSWSRFKLEGRAELAHREYCASASSNRNRWENLYRGGSFLDKSSSDLMALVDPFDLEYLVQQAAAAIYSSGWDAATFIAEISQLRRMLTGIGKSLEKLTDLFDPRRTKNPGAQIAEAANLWLQGRYGWRTLKYDIQDFYEVITTANERRTRYRESKGFTTSGSWSDYAESTSAGIITGISSDISWTGNLRGTVVADIDIPDFQFNPVTTAWEVVRLSFVVDWLLNVGQALEASSFLLKTKNYRSGAGYKFNFELGTLYSTVGTTGSTIVHANDGSSSGDAEVISRIPMSVSALPRMKLRLDEWKVIDLLALTVQRLNRR